MTTMTDDDRLAVMLYVDSEMTVDERERFDTRLAREPALADAVVREQALRARLDAAYAPVLGETIPGNLLDLLALPDPQQAAAPPAANDPVAIGASDAHRAKLPHARRWQWPEWAAMAACLVLGVLVGGRALAPHAPAGLGDTSLALAIGSDGAITAQAGLRDALEQRVAGTVLDPNSNVAVGLTFRDHAKQYCRTFTLAGTSSGIACKQDDGWVVADLEHDAAAASAAAPRATGNYRTAASPYSPALLQAVDALREGDTLDAAAEAAARAKGWKP